MVVVVVVIVVAAAAAAVVVYQECLTSLRVNVIIGHNPNLVPSTSSLQNVF
jgi:hypothetical protein